MLRDYFGHVVRHLSAPDPPSLVRVLTAGPALIAGVIWFGPRLFPPALLFWVEVWVVASALGALVFALRGVGWSPETRARLLWMYTMAGLGLGLVGWEQVLTHWFSHRALLSLLDLAAVLGAIAFVAAGIRYGFEELERRCRDTAEVAEQ